MWVTVTMVNNVRIDVNSMMKNIIGVGQLVVTMTGIIVLLMVSFLSTFFLSKTINNMVILFLKTYFFTDPCNTWPENYFEKNNDPNETLVKEMYQYGRQNLALIHVMVQSPYVTKIKRDVASSFVTFVANTGGLLGLCIGFSFISAVELVYWICCICHIGIKKLLNKKVVPQKQIEEDRRQQN